MNIRLEHLRKIIREEISRLVEAPQETLGQYVARVVRLKTEELDKEVPAGLDLMKVGKMIDERGFEDPVVQSQLQRNALNTQAWQAYKEWNDMQPKRASWR